MANLDRSQCRRLFASSPVARLATVTAEGRPHVVPCCFVIDGDRLYSAIDGKPKSTMALRRLDNIAAQPAVSLVVDHYADDWTELWWVRIDGEACVVAATGDERHSAIEQLTGKYEQYRHSPPVGPVLRVDISHWLGWAFTESAAGP